MLTRKKLLILLVLLLGAVSACQAIQDDTQDASTQETQQPTSVITTEPPTEAFSVETSTVLNLTRKIRQDDLNVFFEAYRQMMLAVAEGIMTQQDLHKVSLGYQQTPYYWDKAGSQRPFDEGLSEKIKALLTIGYYETDYSADLNAWTIDGKWVITFSFTSLEIAKIVYMPDGYLSVEQQILDLTDSLPEAIESIQKSEIKLADNWYSYYS